MGENVILIKSYSFAVNIVKLCFEIQSKKKEYVLSRQLLKSGTSIGANVEEAQGAISKKDFILKMQIALKEAKESLYWLRILKDADVFQNTITETLQKNCNELIVILVSILKSSKE